MNFPYGKTHLWQLLKKMGFGYEKRGRQRIIPERPEIIAWRERYLRRIRKIREADPERAIVYTDETFSSILAEYLKNCPTDFQQTYVIFRQSYIEVSEIKRLKIDHSLLPW